MTALPIVFSRKPGFFHSVILIESSLKLILDRGRFHETPRNLRIIAGKIVSQTALRVAEDNASQVESRSNAASWNRPLSVYISTELLAPWYKLDRIPRRGWFGLWEEPRWEWTADEAPWPWLRSPGSHSWSKANGAPSPPWGFGSWMRYPPPHELSTERKSEIYSLLFCVMLTSNNALWICESCQCIW